MVSLGHNELRWVPRTQVISPFLVLMGISRMTQQFQNLCISHSVEYHLLLKALFSNANDAWLVSVSREQSCVGMYN